jgi:uncharacterized membrane protein YidH (DUF202 family)
MGTALEDIVVENSNHSLVINEVMLLLAEKRTSLSALRTGMGVVAIPLSVVSFLVATSNHYELLKVAYLLAPLWAACSLLFLLGMYMIMRALVRIRRYDERITDVKGKDAEIRSLIDVD